MGDPREPGSAEHSTEQLTPGPCVHHPRPRQPSNEVLIRRGRITSQTPRSGMASRGSEVPLTAHPSSLPPPVGSHVPHLLFRHPALPSRPEPSHNSWYYIYHRVVVLHQ